MNLRVEDFKKEKGGMSAYQPGVSATEQASQILQYLGEPSYPAIGLGDKSQHR